VLHLTPQSFIFKQSIQSFVISVDPDLSTQYFLQCNGEFTHVTIFFRLLGSLEINIPSLHKNLLPLRIWNAKSTLAASDANNSNITRNNIMQAFLLKNNKIKNDS
jgi:hypothetical protein